MSKIDGDVLNISKFIQNCYNISEKRLNRLSHRDLKEMFGLKSVPDAVIDSGKLDQGSILLVKDCNNVVLGYVNPLLNYNYDEIEKMFEINENTVINFEEKEINDINKEELKCFSDYELEDLLKKCKKEKDDKSKNIIVKELQKRSYEDNNTKKEVLDKVRKRELRKE